MYKINNILKYCKEKLTKKNNFAFFFLMKVNKSIIIIILTEH